LLAIWIENYLKSLSETRMSHAYVSFVFSFTHQRQMPPFMPREIGFSLFLIEMKISRLGSNNKDDAM
jgi:hypothetical protein